MSLEKNKDIDKDILIKDLIYKKNIAFYKHIYFKIKAPKYVTQI